MTLRGVFEKLALPVAGRRRLGVLALFIGGFGLAVLAIVGSSLREAAAMKRWPVAAGRVLSAKVEEGKRHPEPFQRPESFGFAQAGHFLFQFRNAHRHQQ